MVPAPPRDDRDVPRFLAELGAPGVIDVHVHVMPERVQRKVWAAFDRLDPAWPITYRMGHADRLRTLREVGVAAHTALAYAHREGMAEWLNEHTLAVAEHHPQVIPTFTFYPETGVDDYVATALVRGGRCAKVHLQVGKFDANDVRLDDVWAELERRGTVVILHAGAVPDGSGGEEWCGLRPVARLLDRFPTLELVVAHLGAPDYEDFLGLAEEAPSVRLDTAMVLTDPQYLGTYPEDLLPRLFDLPGGVVFGSDFPSIPHEFAAQVRGLANRAPDADWLRAVLWETPLEVLGLDADALAEVP
jgi:uncharacterized protein